MPFKTPGCIFYRVVRMRHTWEGLGRVAVWPRSARGTSSAVRAWQHSSMSKRHKLDVFRSYTGTRTKVRDGIQFAGRLAEAGCLEQARSVCNDLVTAEQMRIAADPVLLAQLIEVMFLARGYEQLRRLFVSVEGRTVRFVAVRGHYIQPGIHLVEEADGSCRFVFSEHIYQTSTGAAVISRWAQTAAEDVGRSNRAAYWHDAAGEAEQPRLEVTAK